MNPESLCSRKLASADKRGCIYHGDVRSGVVWFLWRERSSLSGRRQVRNRRVQKLWTEGYLAQYPVNQRIVAGEPIVSKNQGAGRVERSHIKTKSHGFTGRKGYRKFYRLSDGGISGSIN